MPTTTSRNTAFTSRVTKAPALCRHCNKAVSDPPAWMKLIDLMAPGRGTEEQKHRASDLARLVERTPQQTFQMLEQAIEAGAVKKSRVLGVPVYERTWYGRQLLGRWKSVGWRG